MASDAYGATAAATDPRALEGKILLKAAEKLDAVAKRLKTGEDVPRADIVEALEFNRKLWLIFATDAADENHPLRQDIKNNIATLGVFIFKHTNALQADTRAEKFTVLININRNIASGLLKQPAASVEKRAAPAPSGGTTDNMA